MPFLLVPSSKREEVGPPCQQYTSLLLGRCGLSLWSTADFSYDSGIHQLDPSPSSWEGYSKNGGFRSGQSLQVNVGGGGEITVRAV